MKKQNMEEWIIANFTYTISNNYQTITIYSSFFDEILPCPAISTLPHHHYLAPLCLTCSVLSIVG